MKRGGGSPKSRLEMRRKWGANQMKPSLSKDDPEACGELEEETPVLSSNLTTECFTYYDHQNKKKIYGRVERWRSEIHINFRRTLCQKDKAQGTQKGLWLPFAFSLWQKDWGFLQWKESIKAMAAAIFHSIHVRIFLCMSNHHSVSNLECSTLV